LTKLHAVELQRSLMLPSMSCYCHSCSGISTVKKGQGTCYLKLDGFFICVGPKCLCDFFCPKCIESGVLSLNPEKAYGVIPVPVPIIYRYRSCTLTLLVSTGTVARQKSNSLNY
jgi:hypothetical protein